VNARVAVLDDEARMAEVVAMLLRREGLDARAYTDAQALLAALAQDPVDCLVTDLRMPGADGLEVLRRARELDPELPVILMTAYATVPTALEAMREGAFDYVQKPFENEELIALVRRALDVTRLSRENRFLRAELRQRFALDGVVAESAAMRGVLDLVRRAARGRATVLVTGESGTGKELVARALHYHSDRVGGPFVAANCRAFAAGVLESELFGHERGAFTGAERARPGLFERAQGGTVFLDEIGDVGLDFQAKLLRVLQERRVRRVGGDEERELDVRVVAATNRELRAEVDASRFREDLYFRLAVVPIAIPPLRERREDVLPLARRFLALANAELGRTIRGFKPEVERWLTAHAWPGNVRELENAIERGVVLARGEELELADVALATGPASKSEPLADENAGESLQGFLEHAAAERIRRALADANGVKAEAARRLAIDRTTLYRLMRRYGVE
jgi:DNA-binding NtrC family response regulator